MRFLLIIFISLVCSCGRAYFPIEITSFSRSELNKGQENIEIELVSLNSATIKEANRSRYNRRVIMTSDLSKPAKIVPSESLFKENLPPIGDPGPYILGSGDILTVASLSASQERGISRPVSVSDDGSIKIFELGKIRVSGLSQSELEDIIFQKSLENKKLNSIEIAITGFNSKRIFINGDNILPTTLPYTNYPIYLEDALSAAKLLSNESDTKVSIFRDGQEYTLFLSNISNNNSSKIRLFPEDRIYFSTVNYRVENVLVVGETGAQKAVNISSAQRNTLSDVLFSSPTLDKVTSDFSQIYVLRKKKKSFTAYHLDITSPARIFSANSFEMRPGDIVFVGTQPLSLYSRTLSQILGSTGLTLQARDTIRTEIGN